ncbi:MAG: phage holin family protein [Verrucomicrobiota bacterium]
MNESTISIEAGDMGLVIAFVLLIGGIIKNFTPVNNKWIPLITWALGGLLYQWLAGGWADPRQWMMALISVAGATGLHAATKSTFESAGKIPALILIGFLSASLVSLTTGCKSTPAKVAANVSDASKITVEAALRAWNDYIPVGKPSLEKQEQVRDAWKKYKSAQVLLLDCAIIVKESEGAGLKDPQAQEALSIAIAEAGKSLSDLIKLLRTFNVKI